MIKEIQSHQNPLIKKYTQLYEKSRVRRKLGLFVVEGRREIQLALEGAYELETLLICSELGGLLFAESHKIAHSSCVMISRGIYEKLAMRGATEGVLAIFKEKSHGLSELLLKRAHPLILVAEAPEKPGNIGALLRTADAANLDAVIIANPKTDLYNPNTIRSSIGCLFTRSVAVGSSQEIIDYLKENKIRIYCAALTHSELYHQQEYLHATALVVGTEATGLSHEWLNQSDCNIRIPMQGHIDSMNVSVSAGILIFEAKRQRNFDL